MLRAGFAMALLMFDSHEDDASHHYKHSEILRVSPPRDDRCGDLRAVLAGVSRSRHEQSGSRRRAKPALPRSLLRDNSAVILSRILMMPALAAGVWRYFPPSTPHNLWSAAAGFSAFLGLVYQEQTLPLP